MSKLFVYGVSRNCPQSVLEEAFSRHGTVEEVHITTKVSVIDLNKIECLAFHLSFRVTPL